MTTEPTNPAIWTNAVRQLQRELETLAEQAIDLMDECLDTGCNSEDPCPICTLADSVSDLHAFALDRL